MPPFAAPLSANRRTVTMGCVEADPVRGATALVLLFALPAALAGAARATVLVRERGEELLTAGAVVVVLVLLLALLAGVSAFCRPVGRGALVLLVLGSLLALLGAAFGLVGATGEADQRALHDRGVVATGVVQAHSQVGGDAGGLQPQPVFSSDVLLSDGSTLSVETARSARPAVGMEVGVTYDPLGRVPARFGPRPGPVDGTVTGIAEALALAGAFALSAALLAPRRRDRAA